jgi:hypothetical protein
MSYTHNTKETCCACIWLHHCMYYFTTVVLCYTTYGTYIVYKTYWVVVFSLRLSVVWWWL